MKQQEEEEYPRRGPKEWNPRVAKNQKKQTDDEWSWFTKAQIAQLVGLSTQQIERLRKTLAAPERRGQNRRIEIDGPAFVAAYLAKRAANGSGRGAVAEGDGNGGGRRGKDPEREEYRREKDRIELEQMRGDLIPRRDVRIGFGTAAVHLREGIETLRRAHSEKAAEVMIRALEEAEKAIFGITDNGGSSKK